MIVSVVLFAVIVFVLFPIGGDIVTASVDASDVNSDSGNPFWPALDMAGLTDDGSMESDGGMIGVLGLLAFVIGLIGLIIAFVSKMGKNSRA